MSKNTQRCQNGNSHAINLLNNTAKQRFALEFDIPNIVMVSNWGNYDCNCDFIFADNLPVSVNYKGMVYTNGQTFTMSLSQYETFQSQSRGDLTGARVIADQPVSQPQSHNMVYVLEFGARFYMSILVDFLRLIFCLLTLYRLNN